MKIHWIFFISVSLLYCVKGQDPIPEDNDAELWRVLYAKLDRLLDETNTLRDLIQEMGEKQSHQAHDISNLLKHAKNDRKCPAVHVAEKRLAPPPSSTSNSPQEWTVILRRQDGSENFQRGWDDYRNGFGNPQGEFFVGLQKLHEMTTYEGPQELIVILGDWENEQRHAKYDLFEIGGEDEQYAIRQLGEYSGTAGDALAYHRGMKFSTLDHSNSGLCPRNYGGGWWFNNCVDSNLNSLYRRRGEAPEMQKILWSTWKGYNYSLKFAEMKIRPRT
ncbi:fibrinogen C domain-containing protein 1-like [Musca autumnalis]|uniref:fibrinogen C domain-containing protein 1-like n=1 Tax=Musca autumnalis TaxID=221902 RepID=UPI003CF6172A